MLSKVPDPCCFLTCFTVDVVYNHADSINVLDLFDGTAVGPYRGMYFFQDADRANVVTWVRFVPGLCSGSFHLRWLRD
jgi:hypothetical protein